MIKIKISSIPEGLSDLDFGTDSKELELEKESDFPEQIAIHLDIQKFESSYLLNIHLNTVGHFKCDRCLDNFSRQIEVSGKAAFTTDQTLIVRNSDDVAFIAPNQVIIDLIVHTRDLLLLSLPQKNLCSEECKGLCPVCGVNLNHETCKCDTTRYDSRWDVLKTLLEP